MSDTKLIQALIDGQKALKEELLAKITKSDQSRTKENKELKKEMKGGFKEVIDRLNKLGKFLAYLEDDTPTIDEFDKLEKRVTKLEKNFAL